MRLLVLNFFLLFPAISFASQLQLSVQAESAILMNADTGVVLFEKDADKLQYPASITKIATCLFALHALGNRLDDVIIADTEAIATIKEEAKRRGEFTSPAWWIEVGSTHIGIKKDEELTLEDLLLGMMVASGNDAANVIAQYVGGTIPSFLEEMNRYLKNLGCKVTNFQNPHGLHHPKHVTTAREMALITKEALTNDQFRQIVKTVRVTRPKTNKQASTVLVQTNKLLRKGKFFYPKAVGVKTGYTSDAGNTFVTAATHDGRTLIAVLLKTKERDDMFKDAKKMFEVAFSQPKLEKILIKAGAQNQKIRVEGGSRPLIPFVEKDICLQFYPAEEPNYKCLLHLNERLKAPIQKGELVGEIRLIDEKNVIVKKIPVKADEDISKTWSSRFKEKFSWKIALFVCLAGGLLFLLVRKRSK